jgi:hypothetical protein
MTGLIWRDLPGRTKDVTDWSPFAAELRDHPKRWAIIRTCEKDTTARNLASKLRRDPPFAFASGEFEFAQRARDVYARFVGGAS